MTVPTYTKCAGCDRSILAEGFVKRVEAALDRDGVEEFVRWLATPLKGPKKRKRQAEIQDLAYRLRDYTDLGALPRPEEMNDLDDNLREFKVGTLRAVFYTTSSCTDPTDRVTHGFWKNERKTPPVQIRRGNAIAREDNKR